jgi:hypothetical protein
MLIFVSFFKACLPTDLFDKIFDLLKLFLSSVGGYLVNLKHLSMIFTRILNIRFADVITKLITVVKQFVVDANGYKLDRSYWTGNDRPREISVFQAG